MVEGRAPVRILCLPKHEPMGASSRLRTFQYLPYVRSQGFKVEVQSLLGDAYLRRAYEGRTPWLTVARSYAARLWRLLSRRDYDILWIEKELFPWIPEWIIRAIVPSRASVLIDYDDAVFHNYDMHPKQAIRKLLGNKIDRVMAWADMVTAGNDYLAQRARAAGCARVEYLPTVVDIERYRIAERPCRETVVVGWIGSPSTAAYLHKLAPLAKKLSAIYPVSFVAIGARPDQLEGTPFEARPWSESTEVAQLQEIDIGIMPLRDRPWERGKCGYKLIQYMASGLPVVASPVGVNCEIVAHGESGFLANEVADWEEALTSLIESAELRRRFGSVGRKRVEQTYCLQVQGPRLAAFLRELAYAA